MKLRIDRYKMASADPTEYGYSAYVPETDIPAAILPSVSHWSILDSDFQCKWTSFAVATRPEHIAVMAPGWDRYDAWKTHEREANTRLFEIAKSLYPELAQVQGWPLLWTSVDLPVDTPRHTSRYAEVSQ